MYVESELKALDLQQGGWEPAWTTRKWHFIHDSCRNNGNRFPFFSIPKIGGRSSYPGDQPRISAFFPCPEANLARLGLFHDRLGRIHLCTNGHRVSTQACAA